MPERTSNLNPDLVKQAEEWLKENVWLGMYEEAVKPKLIEAFALAIAKAKEEAANEIVRAAKGKAGKCSCDTPKENGEIHQLSCGTTKHMDYHDAIERAKSAAEKYKREV